ncbi:MAG: DUF533 domain-containing protein [Deltaproteobacteria bacterium]|nr:DUF533 domain-containing protein [Deltaproteobacteria bacterium]
MGILDSLQGMINQGANGASGQMGGFGDILSQITGGRTDSGGGPGTGGIFGTPSSPSVLGVSAIGGLVGALLGGKGLRGAAAGALLTGGLQMFNQYRERMKQAAAANPDGPVYDVTPSAPDERARRIVRAIVYAAKSDGHIDEEEKRNIEAQMKNLNLGPDGEKLVREAMDETLDPARIAEGVKTPDEALEVFTVSCAVLNVDQFMERSYLDALAKALNIPDDVRDEIVAKIR